MKRNALVVLAVLTLSTLAFAAFAPDRHLNLYVLNKLLIGNGTEANAITETGSASATINFAAAYAGSELSSAITVTGAQVGDTCVVGVTAAAAVLKAQFSCYVTAANEVKVAFTPLSTQRGTATLVSGTPSTVVVASITASSYCTATPVGTTAAIAAAGLAVSLSTTNLTITGPDSVTTVVNYECAAPVDPASGTFYIRTFSAQ